VAKNDGEWWIYQEVAQADRASKREEVLTDRARLRNPKWWVASTAAALIVLGAYEAIAAQLGDGRFTPSKVLWGALVALGVGAVATLLSALRRP
jgi:hypothetical protein